jgi:hypothetical protein
VRSIRKIPDLETEKVATVSGVATGLQQGLGSIAMGFALSADFDELRIRGAQK